MKHWSIHKWTELLLLLSPVVKAFHSAVRSERTRHRATVRYFISPEPVFIFHLKSYHSFCSVCSSTSVCTVNVQLNQDLWRLTDIYWPLCAHFGQGSSLRMPQYPPPKVIINIFSVLVILIISYLQWIKMFSMFDFYAHGIVTSNTLNIFIHIYSVIKYSCK